MSKNTYSIGTLLAVGVAAAWACGGCQVGDSELGNEVATTGQRLAPSDIDAVLGFEKATAPWDWQTLQGQTAQVGSATDHTEGTQSLSLSNARGYVPIQSIALNSLGARVSKYFAYDIKLPREAAVDNPYWYGATQAYLNSPSAGLYNVYLGQGELTRAPVEQWTTISYAISDDALSKLKKTYTDLRLTIVANVPANATGTYLFDNLRFSHQMAISIAVRGAGAQTRAGIGVVAYDGANATPYAAVTDATGVATIALPPGEYRFGVVDAGSTYFSGPSNHCQVPGICSSATIVDQCLDVVCAPADWCHSAGTCQPDTGRCSNPPILGSVNGDGSDPCDSVAAVGATLSPAQQIQLSLLARDVVSGASAEILQSQWSSLVAAIATGASGQVPDINALVLYVLRESYLDTTDDLRAYADKVKFYNDLKKAIRDELHQARGRLAASQAACGSDVEARDCVLVSGEYVGISIANEPEPTTTPPTVSVTEYAGGSLTNAEQLDAYIQNLENQLNSVGDDAQLANVDLQNVLQKQQQTLQMMSNISKMLHDTAMAIIRKIGG